MVISTAHLIAASLSIALIGVATAAATSRFGTNAPAKEPMYHAVVTDPVVVDRRKGLTLHGTGIVRSCDEDGRVVGYRRARIRIPVDRSLPMGRDIVTAKPRRFEVVAHDGHIESLTVEHADGCVVTYASTALRAPTSA